MNDFRIARFIDLNACRSIFSDFSTFLLGSPERYYHIEGEKQDLDENWVTLGDTTYSSFSWLMSSWVKLEGSLPNEDEWQLFNKHKNNPDHIIALVSSPEKVASFLLDKLKIKEKNAFCKLEHCPVTYYNKGNYKLKSDGPNTPFFKRDCFEHENEYRFVVKYNTTSPSNLPHTHTYIFQSGHPNCYCESISMHYDLLKSSDSKGTLCEQLGKALELILGARCLDLLVAGTKIEHKYLVEMPSWINYSPR